MKTRECDHPDLTGTPLIGPLPADEQASIAAKRAVAWSSLCPACKGYPQAHRRDETCRAGKEPK